MDKEKIKQMFGNIAFLLVVKSNFEIVENENVLWIDDFDSWIKRVTFVIGRFAIRWKEILTIDLEKLDYESSDFLGYDMKIPQGVVDEVKKKYRYIFFAEARLSSKGKVIYLVKGIKKEVFYKNISKNNNIVNLEVNDG